MSETEPEGEGFHPEVLAELVAAGWFDHPLPDFTEGACVDCEDPEDFFNGREGMDRALALCDSCPIREECGRWAERSGQKYGIWGGGFRGKAPRTRTLSPQCPQCSGSNWAYRSTGARYCLTCSNARKRELRLRKAAA